MQQHPVPQAITSYKFKLVGDMTLRQFGELAFGVIIAWLIFNSEINFFFKWTLGPVFGFLGFALAFLPIEDRPLDQWIVNFVKAIYSPTQFTWQAQPKKLHFFKVVKTATKAAKAQPIKTNQLEEYLSTLPATPASTFDQAETKYLEHVTRLFGVLGVPAKKISDSDRSVKAQTADTPLIKSPIKGIRIRKLMHPQLCLLPHASVYQAPLEPQAAAMPTKIKPSTQPLPKTTPSKPMPKTKPASTNNLGANAPKTAKNLVKVHPATAGQPLKATTYASNVILPQTPDKPNLLAGITLDKQGKIIPSVILEVRNQKNHPVRALRSNKLGQFFIATPLADGIYQIAAEHQNHRFAIMKLEVKSEVIPPLKIQAI